MKAVFYLFVTVAVFTFASVARAQDPIKVAPDMYKLKMAEHGVRVLEVTFKPGQNIAPHSHPDHIIYALQGGKIEITEEGKAPNTMDVKTGDALYVPAQKHHARSLSKGTMKFLVVEFGKR